MKNQMTDIRIDLFKLIKMTEKSSSNNFLSSDIELAQSIALGIYLRFTQISRPIKSSHNPDGSKVEVKKKRVSGHLQPVHGELSDEQIKSIREAFRYLKTDKIADWKNRVEVIRNEHDRRFSLEMIFCSVQKKYIAKVYKGIHLAETWEFVPARRNEIRFRIDENGRIRVPWAQIKSGTPWVVDIELSPYYLEESWVPSNVIPFK